MQEIVHNHPPEEVSLHLVAEGEEAEHIKQMELNSYISNLFAEW